MSSNETQRELVRLQAENQALRGQLDDALETLEAIRCGAVDALVIDTAQGQRVFTLQGAEHPYRVLVERMQEGALTLLSDGTILYCNHRFAEMVAKPLEAVIGTSVASYIHEYDWPAFKNLLQHSTEGGARGEVNFCRPNGELLPVQVGSSLLDGEGDAAFGLVVTDLTERKRAEAILASERFARTILNQAADAILVCDAAGRLVFANAAARKLARMDPQGTTLDMGPEIWGKACGLDGKPVPPDEWLLPQALQGRTVTACESHMVRDDGTAYDILISASPLKDSEGTTIGAVATFSDITESKRARQALQESELRYRTLFESIDEGFCVIEVLFDADGKAVDYRFLEANPAFERHSGVKQALGKTMRELVPGHDEYWFEIYGKVTSTGEPVRVERYAAAMERWFDVYAFRIGPPDKRRVAVLFTDISQRKAAEQERVSLLEAERAARGQAESLVRLKDEFLATVSHELRTPLSAIVGWTRLLGKGSIEPAKAVDIIRRSASTLTQLVEDLLDMSRIISGKVRLKREIIDLVSILSDVSDGIRPAAEAKSIQVHVAVEHEADPIYCDPNRVQQIIWNLLSNAVKFTPTGGHVWVGLRQLPGQVQIEVRDTGQGIAAEFLPHLFQRFRQEDGSVARRHGGLGLGLAITRQLVELHGGTIEADSPGTGRGSTFTVRLPNPGVPMGERSFWPMSSRATAPAVPEVDEYLLQGIRILGIDDDPHSRELLVRVLSEFGAELRAVDAAEHVLDLLEEFRPDVIISDVGMPGEDGYTLIRRLRRTGDWRASIPCIALTALSRPEDRDQTRAAGFDEHVSKPFEPGALCLLVAGLVGRNRGSAGRTRSADDARAAEPPQAREAPGRVSHILLAEDCPHVAEMLKAILEERGWKVTSVDKVAEGIAAMRADPADLLLSDLRLKDGMGWDLMKAVRGQRDVPGIMMSGYADPIYVGCNSPSATQLSCVPGTRAAGTGIVCDVPL